MADINAPEVAVTANRITPEEYNAQIEADNPVQSTGFWQGAKAGLLGLPAAIAFTPSEVILNSQMASDLHNKYNEFFGIKGEPKPEDYISVDKDYNQQFDNAQYTADKAKYLAGEGLTSGGLFGAFRKGLVKKAIGISGLGAENALTNTAIGMMTDDPTMRIVASLPTGVLVNGEKAITKYVESKYKGPTVDPITGVPLTNFQATGDGKQGALELSLRMNPEAVDKVNYFDIAQNKSIDNFINGIQKFVNRTDLSTEKIANGVQNAYKNYTQSLVTKLKNDATQQFGAAKAAGANPNIQLNNTRNVIKDMLATVEQAAPGSDRVGDMKRLLAEYPDTSQVFTTVKNPLTLQIEQVPTTLAAKGINIDSLQQQLAAWGDAASTGIFKISDNATVGVAKGQARKVLQGLQQDLDNAIADGTPGAKELKIARDNFRENLGAVRRFSNKNLSRYFGSDRVLTEENAVERLTKAKPSEKLDMMAVLQDADPALADSIRKRTFTDLYKKVYDNAPSAGKGNVNVSGVLKTFGNLDEKELRYLFPTQQEFASFKQGLAVMQKATREIQAGQPMFNDLRNDVSLAAGSIGGAQARYQASIAWDVMKKISTLSPEKQAILLFDPAGKAALKAFKQGNYNYANTLWDGLGLLPATQTTSAANLMLGNKQVQEKSADRNAQLNALFAPQNTSPTNLEGTDRVKALQELFKTQ